MTSVRGIGHRHPDLDENGDLLPDVFQDPARRNFNRMMADPVQRAAFMQQVTRWQSSLPEDTQRMVQGRGYGAPGGDAYDGWLRYRAHVQDTNQWAHTGELTGADVDRMSLEEYNAAFDETGRPRPGYSFRRTERDVRFDDGMDQSSTSELRNLRGPRR
jgi:hypothetical protein